MIVSLETLFAKYIIKEYIWRGSDKNLAPLVLAAGSLDTNFSMHRHSPKEATLLAMYKMHM